MKTLTIKRPWGQFDQFTQNENTTVKIISINSLESLSLQSHTKRSEFWRIIGGNGVVEIGEIKNNAIIGDEYDIPINVKHRATAGLDGLIFLEIDEGDFDENDEVKYEDKYGRT
jgi:mannose-6-phosphate isomerase-like protein (cupin superfamily)